MSVTARQLLDKGIEKLTGVGIADAKSDSLILFEYATGINRNDIYVHPEADIDEGSAARFLELTDRRMCHEPVQYITGSQEFMGLEFSVDERVLIPRFDTEILVEEGIKLGLSGMRILDLCTGSGCILLSLLHYSHDCSGIGVDISNDALTVARQNARRLNIEAEFIQCDLYDGLPADERFDLIVSNPPYIRSDVIPTLMEEVRDHEPLLALDGSPDGLMFYRRIISKAPMFLYKEGVLMMEIGFDQGDDVSGLMEQAGLADIKVIKDLSGLDRVVVGRN